MFPDIPKLGPGEVVGCGVASISISFLCFNTFNRRIYSGDEGDFGAERACDWPKKAGPVFRCVPGRVEALQARWYSGS
jgi:hypothetical protein